LFRSSDSDPQFAHLVVAVLGAHLLHELFRHIYNGKFGADFDFTDCESWNVAVIGERPDDVGGTDAVGLVGVRYQTNQDGFMGLVGFELLIRQPDIRISIPGGLRVSSGW
jgi:hypothetical protein